MPNGEETLDDKLNKLFEEKVIPEVQASLNRVEEKVDSIVEAKVQEYFKPTVDNIPNVIEKKVNDAVGRLSEDIKSRIPANPSPQKSEGSSNPQGGKKPRISDERAGQLFDRLMEKFLGEDEDSLVKGLKKLRARKEVEAEVLELVGGPSLGPRDINKIYMDASAQWFKYMMRQGVSPFPIEDRRKKGASEKEGSAHHQLGHQNQSRKSSRSIKLRDLL